MSRRVASVHAFSSYDHRMVISEAGDRYQDRVITSVLDRGFSVDWNVIFAAVEAQPHQEPAALIRQLLQHQLHSRKFVDTDAAVILNGDLIAQYVQQRHEREIAARVQTPVMAARIEFAEPDLFIPEAAAAYWKKVLDLSDADVALLLENLNSLQSSSFALAGRLTTSVMNRVAELLAESIQAGKPRADFINRAREVLPGATSAMLEAEYRTRLTLSYGGSRYEQIKARANVFPFIQYMIIRDSRTTWWICLPMGTCGPGARGFIASVHDPIWIQWTPPNHYNCRSDLSPISYLEAQRLGILARDGRTLLAVIGSNPSRPFGEPPKFASDPITGTLRRVQPALGFG